MFDFKPLSTRNASVLVCWLKLMVNFELTANFCEGVCCWRRSNLILIESCRCAAPRAHARTHTRSLTRTHALARWQGASLLMQIRRILIARFKASERSISAKTHRSISALTLSRNLALSGFVQRSLKRCCQTQSRRVDDMDGWKCVDKWHPLSGDVKKEWRNFELDDKCMFPFIVRTEKQPEGLLRIISAPSCD